MTPRPKKNGFSFDDIAYMKADEIEVLFRDFAQFIHSFKMHLTVIFVENHCTKTKAF